eukprot:TRINITY_DN8047_c0_g1_i1.p1 TRINITY_DN8047_c0_g1~~TRINITY_DN8047_c0_g1_i1.p1  ORF type:complete len:459 (+),score=51.52 TRINITY_DN8047_c0_g1_i1:49-1425(+)
MQRLQQIHHVGLSAVGSGKRIGEHVGKRVSEHGKRVGEHGKRVGEHLGGACLELVSQLPLKAERAKAKMMDIAAPVRHGILMSIRDIVKTAIMSDPHMWNWIRRHIKAAIDSMFDDIEEEVNATLQDVILKREKSKSTPGPACCGPCGCIRAWILHHYFPYDRSIFGKMKDLVWWVFTIWSLIPFYGARVAMFAIILLLHLLACPPDEYQIVTFILQFKGWQFLTGGIISICVGAMQYFYCFSSAANIGASSEQLLTCMSRHGPGAIDSIWSELFDYFGCVALCWIAFLALPCSDKYDKPTYVGRDHPPEQPDEIYCCFFTGVRTRGGRLRHLLLYDMIAFFVSLVFLFVLSWLTRVFSGKAVADIDDVRGAVEAVGSIRQFQENLFWSKAFYALLSFPFVPFAIPGLATILTHSRPTGYNNLGACVAVAYDEPNEPPSLGSSDAGSSTSGCDSESDS